MDAGPIRCSNARRSRGWLSTSTTAVAVLPGNDGSRVAHPVTAADNPTRSAANAHACITTGSASPGKLSALCP